MVSWNYPKTLRLCVTTSSPLAKTVAPVSDGHLVLAKIPHLFAVIDQQRRRCRWIVFAKQFFAELYTKLRADL